MRFYYGELIELTISISVLENMKKFVQKKDSYLESGGLLFGESDCDGNHFSIVNISEPLNTDISTRNRFHLSMAHQEIVSKLWKESSGYINYLGSWHTHPERDVHPSNIDLKSWRKSLINDIFYQDYLFFVIMNSIGRTYAWIGEKNCNKITRMEGGIDAS